MRILLLAAALPVLVRAETGVKLTSEQMERFLETARIVKLKTLGTGITNSQRATLTDGTFEHDAHVQIIDEAKSVFQGERGTELNFRDTWKFNIAAYRLARMLGLDMVPPSIERKVQGKSAAVTWWLEDCMMEVDRKKRRAEAPDKDVWNREMHVVRVFDQLIFNTDRNLQNLLIDRDWHIWMIDHTRAFRRHTGLQAPKNLIRCDRQLLATLRELDAEKLSALKPYVTDVEIRGLLGRRDAIVKVFDRQMASKGEALVLFDRPLR